MDRQPYESFFLRPTDTWHRRYEALRAIFVEQRPLSEIADRRVLRPSCAQPDPSRGTTGQEMSPDSLAGESPAPVSVRMTM